MRNNFHLYWGAWDLSVTLKAGLANAELALSFNAAIRVNIYLSTGFKLASIKS